MSKMLDGLTVIDFTGNLAGPSCGAMMADHGAEVIHIEKPVWGDDSRHFFPMLNGTCPSFSYHNRSKKSVTIDIRDPQGVKLIKEMLRTADVFLESNRPGVMAKYGLAYEDVKDLNPQLVYCSISAFGQNGPYAARPGYDIIAQAYSGMMYYTGEPGGDPVKNYFAVGDFFTGVNAFGSIMTALYHRAQTGRGQFIDVALARTLLTLNGFMEGGLMGYRRKRIGNKDDKLCPYGIYKGPNGSNIVLAALSVTLWSSLCMEMGHPEYIEDPRFVTNDKRCENQDAVTEIIESWLTSLPSAEDAIAHLDHAGIPNSKVYDIDDIMNDEHANSQGWIQPLPLLPSQKAESGRCVFGYADFSDGETVLNRAPEFGEHNMEIFTRYGMSAEEAAAYSEKWHG